MLTIKYVWLYVIILVAGAGGFGAGYMVPSSDEDLVNKLKLANEQIERISVDCDKPKETFKRGEIVKSPSRGF
jgi:hypothetical protein